MVGHAKQQNFFRQAVAAGQLSHAYILVGPEGVGKKQLAKEFAMGLLCNNRVFFNPCECPSCRQIKENTHPDFHLFEDKEDLKIENVRKIAELSSMTTYSGKWKVFIIDNAHILSQGGADAANALLKTLEEPGKNTLFLLITSREERILPTILSRCVKVNFDSLNDRELKTVLRGIDSEKKWETVISYASGSVSRAKFLIDIDVNEFLDALVKKDRQKLGYIVLALNNKEVLYSVLGFIQIFFINIYKEDQAGDTAFFIQYLSVVMKNLDYNVNITFTLLELYTKLVEALKL